MSERLSKGTKIKTVIGVEFTVDKHLGEGGQGDVYAITYNGQPKALKWYKKGGMGKDPKNFYKNISDNIGRGSPDPAFLWPIDMTEWIPDEFSGTFGYVMDLRPQDHYEICDFMLTSQKFTSFKIAVDAALNIVSAFRILHNKGYSYQDLNDGNFFVSPLKGTVKICDNDNVAPDGFPTGILGKPRYMAPEVVTGKSMPNAETDLFSMAVILFMLLVLNHPLEGKRSLSPCLDPSMAMKIYGTDPLFIMDKDNKDNAPDPQIHTNALAMWKFLPSYMKEIFQKALSKDGLSNPNLRPTEIHWLKALIRFRNDIVVCSCGNNIFTENAAIYHCDSCSKRANIPFKFVISDYSFPAVANTRLYYSQFNSTSVASRALELVGGVLAKKDDPTKLGLKNLSGEIWSAKTPSGKVNKVEPDGIVPLIDGIEISIGEETLKIIKIV